jgi:hypothetical protein
MQAPWTFVALLDGLAFGGLLAMLLVRNLLLTIVARLVTATAQAEILNVLDQLLPYVLGFAAASLGMAVVTLITWMASRLGATRQTAAHWELR